MGLRFLIFILLIQSLKCLQLSNATDNKKIFWNIFNRRTTTIAPLLKSCECSCGERNEGRIVGGKQVVENEFPWMVRLSYFNTFYCGGTLISDRYVITAAHCVKGFLWFLIKVTFGEHDRCKSQKPETRYVIRSTVASFSLLNFRNDIALLRLNDRVSVSENIRPICLPKNHRETYAGKLATVSGWGAQREDGTPACILQKVDVPVLSDSECKNSNYTEKLISETMICAGYEEGGKDSCKGDSGGPLVYQREDAKFELIGIVSWGYGCARAGFPGVYTRVTHQLDWIKDNTKESCYCDN